MQEQDKQLPQVEVDTIYYEPGTIHLNKQGLEHLYLLIAGELKLWHVEYKWEKMPVVRRAASKRKVLQPLQEMNKKRNKSSCWSSYVCCSSGVTLTLCCCL